MKQVNFREQITMTKYELCLVVVMLFLISLLIAACSTLPETIPAPQTSSPAIVPPSSAPAVPSEPTTTHPTETESPEPVLSNNLKRDCQINRDSEGFDTVGLSIGETAVNFALRDIYGTEVQLSRLLSEKPVVMVFGSFT